MDRFPLLSMYRGLMQIAAVLVLIVGFLGGIDAAEEGTLEFFVMIFWAVMTALGLLITAELIHLALSIEDHLYQMSNKLSSLRNVTSSYSGVTPAPTSSSSSPKSDPASPPLDSEKAASARFTPGAASAAVLAATVSQERAVIVTAPRDKYNVWAITVKGKQVVLYGRTVDNQWVQIEEDQPRWVEAANLDIDGDVSSLPITFQD